MSYGVLFLHLLIFRGINLREIIDLHIPWFTDLNGAGRLYLTQSVLKL